MAYLLRKRFYIVLLISGLCIGHSVHSQIDLEFCPVTKIQASKNWNTTITIRNNTGVVLDLANNGFNMDWPSLVGLQWPFTVDAQNGINWSFRINLDWPGTLAVGASASKTNSGNLYSGVLQFPTSGTYTQDGVEYYVNIEHCSQTNAYELYDETVEFDRNCFIYSPTSNLCLGEAATEVWQGEGIYDVMVPTDRPSWAIATMVAHRLFTNMAGAEMLSPNFWTATALNESRMTCDNTIVPNRQNHCYINSGVAACQGDGVGNIGGTTNGNCFQILNIGYTQLENNQPDLFAQTNAYGTASYNTVVADGHWETGAIAVAYYHYQDIRYWNQIYCWNTNEVFQDSQDPYAIEKIFYHAYHDGPNAGIQLLNQIDADYANAVAATNMNTVVAGNGTWASTNTGSQKVGNFTSLLDGNGVIYPTNKSDYTTEYYGCYTADIQWSDVLYYLNEVKILYPQLMDPTVQADIQAVFDGLNGGADVAFSNFGPVIDEIVIQMGGHDPSSYIATQYAASKSCGENPVGVSLRSDDTLCPGESGFLQVWLAGDPNFRVDIQYPDGSTNTFSGITSSPYYIPITQPGDYEVVYFEDNDEVGDINCNFAAITVESRNSAIIGWDKTSVDLSGCASGDLIINKQGDDPVTVSYTFNGTPQPDINLGSGDLSQTVSGSPAAGEYIITTMSPNFCGTPINDTIEFCGTTPCTPPTYSILTPDTSICDGATANIRLSFGGTGPFDLYYTSSTGGAQSVIGIAGNSHVLSLTTAQTIQVDSVIEGTCVNDAGSSVSLSVNPIPVVDLGTDTSICSGASLILDAENAGSNYLWSTTEASQTISVNTANNYSVQVTDGNGCVSSDDINVGINSLPVVDLGNDTTICNGASLILDAGNAGSTYLWSTTESTQTISVNSANTYSVQVTDGSGCVGSDDIDVSLSPNLPVNLGNDTAICAGSSLILDAQFPGSTYVWSTTESTQTISVNSAANYSVQVTNPSGCSGTDDINVSIVTNPIVDLGNDTTICDGASLNLDAQNSGATYLWSTTESSQTISVSTANNYSVQVTDGNGCVGSDDINVSIQALPVVDLGNDTTICNGTTLTLDAQNVGATYSWSTTESTQTISVNGAGNYSVQVTDGIGCNGSDDVDVSIAADLPVDLGSDTSICSGSSLTLDAGFPGSNYSWSTTESSQTISVNSAGNYTVQVSDVNGCTGSDDINVALVTSLPVDLGNDTSICAGESIVLDAQFSGSNYSWSTLETSQTISVNSAGNYSVQVTDASGCTGTDDITIGINALPVVDLGNDTTICDGTTLTLDASNAGSNFNWTTTETSQTIDVTTGNTYAVTVTDINGCAATDDIIVTVSTVTVVSITIPSDVCADNGIVNIVTSPSGGVLSGNGVTGTQFDPQGGSVVLDAANTITYDFTNSDNCSAQASEDIIVHSIPNPSQTVGDVTICSGDNIVLNVNPSGSNTIEWYEVGAAGIIGTSSNLNVTTSGSYYAIESNTVCSSSSDTTTIDVVTASVLGEASPSQTIDLGESVSLSVVNPSGSYTYSWFDNNTGATMNGDLVSVTPTLTTTYTLTGVLGGCLATFDITIDVKTPVIIPNAFTPNGDTENDEFVISGIESYPKARVQIFNRWGTKVYQSVGEYVPWTGIRDGKLMPTATYYYIIELNDSEGIVLNGSVTLVL